MKVAFIGLGVMGYPMAGHLVRAAHQVSVFNPSPEKALRWTAEHGGRAGASIAEAVQGCEAVALCVGNDDDVRGCLAQALPAMAEGGVVIDHTTTSAKLAREAAGLAREAGRWFVDAPVSGGQAGAQGGTLSVMAGGDEVAFALAEPVIGAYAKAIRRIGGPGSGQLCKMVNQICIAGVVQGLAEAVHFAKTAGLDTEAVSPGRTLEVQRRPVLADGQPVCDHDRGQVRVRLRCRLDAQGPGPRPRRGADQRRTA